MEANIAALNAREPENPALKRYEYAAQFLLFDRSATVEDAMEWISETSRIFDIPGLGAYGVREADFAEIVAKSSVASSMKGNPIALTADELSAILRKRRSERGRAGHDHLGCARAGRTSSPPMLWWSSYFFSGGSTQRSCARLPASR